MPGLDVWEEVSARGCGCYEIQHIGDHATGRIVGNNISVRVAVLVSGRRRWHSLPVGSGHRLDRVPARNGLPSYEYRSFSALPVIDVVAVVRVEVRLILLTEAPVVVVLLGLSRRNAAVPGRWIVMVVPWWIVIVVIVMPWRSLGDSCSNCAKYQNTHR